MFKVSLTLVQVHCVYWILDLPMQALIDTSDREIFASLTCCYSDKRERGKGVVSTQLIGERTQIILDEVRALSLFTRTQCLVHIGTFWQFDIFILHYNFFKPSYLLTLLMISQMQASTFGLQWKDLKKMIMKP